MTDLTKCFLHPLWTDFSDHMIASRMWQPHWVWADAYDSEAKDYWWAKYWTTFLAGAKAQKGNSDE